MPENEKQNNINHWECINYCHANYATLSWCSLHSKYAFSFICMVCIHFERKKQVTIK